MEEEPDGALCAGRSPCDVQWPQNLQTSLQVHVYMNSSENVDGGGERSLHCQVDHLPCDEPDSLAAYPITVPSMPLSFAMVQWDLPADGTSSRVDDCNVGASSEMAFKNVTSNESSFLHEDLSQRYCGDENLQPPGPEDQEFEDQTSHHPVFDAVETEVCVIDAQEAGLSVLSVNKADKAESEEETQGNLERSEIPESSGYPETLESVEVLSGTKEVPKTITQTQSEQPIHCTEEEGEEIRSAHGGETEDSDGCCCSDDINRDGGHTAHLLECKDSEDTDKPEHVTCGDLSPKVLCSQADEEEDQNLEDQSKSMDRTVLTDQSLNLEQQEPSEFKLNNERDHLQLCVIIEPTESATSEEPGASDAFEQIERLIAHTETPQSVEQVEVLKHSEKAEETEEKERNKELNEAQTELLEASERTEGSDVSTHKEQTEVSTQVQQSHVCEPINQSEESEQSEEPEQNIQKDDSKQIEESNINIQTEECKQTEESNINVQTEECKQTEESNINIQTEECKQTEESNINIQTEECKQTEESNINVQTEEPDRNTQTEVSKREEHAENTEQTKQTGPPVKVEQTERSLVQHMEGKGEQLGGQMQQTGPSEAVVPYMNGGGVDREEARRLADRLFRLEDVQRTDVARHLDKDNEFSRIVGEEYLKFFEFTDQSLDQALRTFLKVVVLIGETQERERVLQRFSSRYHQCNPDSFSSAGTVLTLTCAMMLLNTDLHGQNVGKAMSQSNFVSNLDGMNDGENFNKDLLKSLYNSIKSEPLEWAVDEKELQSSLMLPEDAEMDPAMRSRSNPFQHVPHNKRATVFHKGFLKRKAHANIDGKRIPWGKRGWKTFYAVLKGMVLYLQKDDYRMDGHTLEEVVSVHHALAEKALDYTKRPHVFRLQTADWRIFLFEAGSKEQMSSWIARINLVSALYSSPPFPAAVGSQRKFIRPILPASQSVHTVDKQLQSHAAMLHSFQEDLAQLQQGFPEGRKPKARELEEHKLREEYLQHERCRYEVYVQVLEAWKGAKRSSGAEVQPHDLSLFDQAVCKDNGEEEESKDGVLKRSYSSPSLELEMAPPPVVKVRRNISERRTYRKIIIPRRNREL
ncbi:uncharacterized protein LOC114787083 isoform X3 [Denticeps clupeoides]|uniref:uncharacterized protein LOC114787083 isoform X3 n=1 Tax=Denticeps clupeoides TaxID=299321 RepID=UPI0010A4CCD5|nr:uncharacterized protein LOC114787083 isoform X3 [Denticeps clupeoides]